MHIIYIIFILFLECVYHMHISYYLMYINTYYFLYHLFLHRNFLSNFQLKQFLFLLILNIRTLQTLLDH